MRLLPCRFSCDENSTISCTTFKDKPADRLPAAGERILLEALEHYGFLNVALLQRILKIGHHNSINARKSIKKMQQQGKVEKYTISHEGQEANTDVYILSRKMREKLPVKVRRMYKFDMDNIPYIMEHLAVAQWHISLLSRNNTVGISYNEHQRIDDISLTIPSIVKYKTLLGRKTYISAIPACKGKKQEDLSRFLLQVALMDKYFSTHADLYPSITIAVICESERQLEEMARFMASIKETSGIFFLYSLDAITADEEVDPLSMLYMAQVEDGAVTTELISLK